MLGELKEGYYTLLSKNKVLPYSEYSFKVPISTGSPLLDSSLVEKIRTTPDLMDHEHLLRSWKLFKNISGKEEKVLMKNLDELLNDHKILLALVFWERGDKKKTYHVLNHLPWGWRVQLPTLIIKPSYVFFTGWKKNLDFRLVEDIDFDGLRELFGKILENINELSIVKYKRKIKTSWALLRYKPTTKREKATEDWCFHKGENADTIKLTGIYTKARDLLNKEGKSKFIKYLDKQDETIPLTSYMGMLGNNKIDLKKDGDDRLRDYALRSASYVETILRLNEWSQWPKGKAKRGFRRFLPFQGPYWLDGSKAKEISKKIRKGKVSINIPFDKIAKAYLNCNSRTKELLTDDMFIPLLKKFGKEMGKILPPKFSFVQPANMIHIDNFLTYNVLNVSSNGKMVLIGEEENKEFTFSVDELKDIIHKPQREVEEYLLKKFGEMTDKYQFKYDADKITKTLSKISKSRLLIIDMPFIQKLDIMNSIKEFDYVLNMNAYYGAPNEISLCTNYKPDIKLWTPSYFYGVFSRENNAYQLIQYIRLINVFEKMGEEYGNNNQS